MHHKKSEAQIGKESFDVSSDFSPSPHPLLPLFHHHQPKPSSFIQIHVPDDSHPHHAPHFLLSSPHKRSLMNASPATCHHRHPAPAHHHHLRHHPRLLPHFSAAATRSALHLCLLLLPSLPSLYLLLSPFPSSSPGIAARCSLIVDFLFALAFSSVLLLLLALSLNAFPVPSLHLLLSCSSALLLSRSSALPLLWSIGSSIDKPKADRRPASGLGVQVYSNEDIYEGEFHQGKCSGSRVYCYYMSGRYDWVDGKYDGYGMETWAWGSRYRGQYHRGLRHALINVARPLLR